MTASAKHGRRGATRVDPSAPSAPAHGGEGSAAAEGGVDRHIFFTAKSPAQPPEDSGGVLSVECASCHTTSRMSPLQWTRAHAPLFVWVPLMRYSRFALCPACGRRSWVRLSLHR